MKKLDVTLSHPATDPETGTDVMRISRDGAYDTAQWVRYASTSTLVLTGGKGVKTVWVQFANQATMRSAIVTDTIIYKP